MDPTQIIANIYLLYKITGYCYHSFWTFRSQRSASKKFILVFVQIIERPPHDEQSWQYVDENSPDPWCHCVRLRSPKMYVENYNCHAYAEKKYQITVYLG